MSGLTIIMFIFGLLIFLAGLYVYTGHKNSVLLWKCHNINKLSKKDLKTIGKWTMISSIIPFILSIIGLFIKE